IDVELPLHRLVCLTGVSGSGKSTLVQDVLYPALQKAHGKPSEAPGRFERLVGAELVEAAVLIDQTPIGRTTRSNPASYVGAFDEIRARFRAETLQIRIQGADARRKNIAEVLEMTATEALAFFADRPAVCARLQPLVDVGLDYVRLGQPVPTLSGGEAP